MDDSCFTILLLVQIKRLLLILKYYLFQYQNSEQSIEKIESFQDTNNQKKITKHMSHYYLTPSQNGENTDRSRQNVRYESTGVIDYKGKTFELMQVVTEMQIRHKDMEKTVFYLQRELEIIHRELEEFLTEIEVKTLAQVRERYVNMQRELQEAKSSIQKPLIKQEKLTREYEKILGEYKVIIKAQEEKMVKYQQKWKQKQLSLIEKSQLMSRQNEQLREELVVSKSSFDKQRQEIAKSAKQETDKLNGRISQLTSDIQQLNGELHTLRQEQLKMKQTRLQTQAETMQLKKDFQLIKSQFRQLFSQKQSLQQKHERLKKKYKQEIQHFEIIQKQVEEKLIEVEKEITFYKQQREAHLEQISSLKKQCQHMKHLCDAEDKEEFSFGGYYNAETQTEESDFVQSKGERDDDVMSPECYQISIKSLLEENNRLKRTLLLIQRARNQDELPPEAELELKLLKGLIKGNGTITKQKENKSNQKPYKQREILNIDFIEQSGELIKQMEVFSPKFRHEVEEIGRSQFMKVMKVQLDKQSS